MKQFTFIILCITIMCSCTKNTDPYKKLKITGEVDQSEKNQLPYTLIFPDTVKVNTPYTATIEFKSEFDNILDPIHYATEKDSSKMRLVIFYRYEIMSSPLKKGTNLIVKDSTFVSNKKFDIENIIFKKKGEFIFSGLIYDEIMYNYYNKNGVRDSVHFSTKEQKVLKKVIVID